MERLGFGYDAVAARNPRAIWCGISGLRPRRPDARQKGVRHARAGGVGRRVGDGQRRTRRRRSASRSPTSRRGCTRTRRSSPRCSRARTTGRRRAYRHLDARVSHRVDDAGAVRVAGRGARRCTRGRAPQHDRAVRRVRVRRRRRDVRRFRPIASGAASAPRCWAMPSLADDPRFATNAERVANRVALEAMIEAAFRRACRAPTSSRCSSAPTSRPASVNDVPAVVDASAARGAQPLDARRLAGRRDSGVAPAAQSSTRARRAWARVPALGEHTDEVLAHCSRPT